MADAKNILLFDGTCNLCSGLVNFIIKRDKERRITFVSLQSPDGQSLLRKFSLPTDDIDTVVYIKDNVPFLRSGAILHVLHEMGGIWRLFFVFIIIPRFLRDFIYKIIAKTRYRIFGRNDSCIY